MLRNKQNFVQKQFNKETLRNIAKNTTHSKTNLLLCFDREGKSAREKGTPVK